MTRIYYTCLTGDCDDLQAAPQLPPGWLTVCFTDRWRSAPNWRYVRLQANRDPRRASRRPKILAHKWLSSAEITIYADANLSPRGNVDELVDRALANYDLAVYRHFARDCVYQEAAEVVRTGVADRKQVERQVAHYRNLGYPEHAGLAECGLLIRRHTKPVADFEEFWWREYECGCCRDQISFPIAAWWARLPVNYLPPLANRQGDFIRRPHRNESD